MNCRLAIFIAICLVPTGIMPAAMETCYHASIGRSVTDFTVV